MCFKGEEAQYQMYYFLQLKYATSVLQLNCLVKYNFLSEEGGGKEYDTRVEVNK